MFEVWDQELLEGNNFPRELPFAKTERVRHGCLITGESRHPDAAAFALPRLQATRFHFIDIRAQ